MASYEVSATRRIAAPASRVYAVISDYRDGHPHILPPSAFRKIDVERGGIGEGTVFRVELRVLGATSEMRMAVTEPVPGRVLAETDLASNAVTTFTVDEDAGGESCTVTIATTLNGRGGPVGALERFTTARLLRRLYDQELDMLEKHVS